MRELILITLKNIVLLSILRHETSFMTYHQVCNKSNMTGATSGEGTAYPSGASEFIPGFLCSVCRSLFCPQFSFSFVLSVLLLFIDSDYLFVIFKLVRCT